MCNCRKTRRIASPAGNTCYCIRWSPLGAFLAGLPRPSIGSHLAGIGVLAQGLGLTGTALARALALPLPQLALDESSLLVRTRGV